MGLNKQEYYQRHQNTLKQRMVEQDAATRERLSDKGMAMRTTWQKDKPIMLQKRPERDLKKEQEDAYKELAKAGTAATDDYNTKASSVIVTKGTQARWGNTMQTVPQQPVITDGTQPQQSASTGRNIERHSLPVEQREEAENEHQKVISEFQQKQLDRKQRMNEEKAKIHDFLQPDDWMMFGKFVIVHDYEDYTRKVRDRINIPEITGVYIIANVSKFKVYVGKSSKAIEKCGQHFRRRITTEDSVPAIREDMLLEDTIGVNFVKLKDTDFDTIKDLADYYIRKYNCREPHGYNPSIIKG